MKSPLYPVKLDETDDEWMVEDDEGDVVERGFANEDDALDWIDAEQELEVQTEILVEAACAFVRAFGHALGQRLHSDADLFVGCCLIIDKATDPNIGVDVPADVADLVRHVRASEKV
jgi:hypothetical protein